MQQRWRPQQGVGKAYSFANTMARSAALNTLCNKASARLPISMENSNSKFDKIEAIRELEKLGKTKTCGNLNRDLDVGARGYAE